MTIDLHKLFAITLLAIGVLILPLLSTSAYAHRVTVFAWVEDGEVFTQSKFGAGAKVNNGQIFVYDSSGQELLRGQTDSNGEFSFPIPAHQDLKIVLDATMGHRAEWTVPANELGGQADTEVQQTAATAPPQPSEGRPEQQQVSPQLEAAMERILDRKLKPINHLLAELQQTGPTLHDIIAGLGYIAGLIGVAAWLQARKKSS